MIVIVATVEVETPTALLAVQKYPPSEMTCAFVMARPALVAPESGLPFLCH